MSNALAIAGVTAVLRDLLDSGVIEHQITDTLGAGVTVSALPPDQIAIEGTAAAPRLNLFLHQVTPNAALRNTMLPMRDTAGRRTANPPLALDLHYLLTAYGVQELQAEVLLGYALLMLHETPVLTREAIRTALQPSPVSAALLPTVFQALRAADLADQLELLKITPQNLAGEEMSRLWSALQARYRPTAAFQVSVVLIERRRPVAQALPVLTRGSFNATLQREEGVIVAAGLSPPFPTLEGLLASAHETPSTLLPGDAVQLVGHHLAGTNRSLMLRNQRFGIEQAVALPDGTAETGLTFNLPVLPAALPAGVWQLELRVQRPGEALPRTSNTLPLALAPRLTSLPPVAASRDGNNTVSITMAFEPAVRVGQKVSLMLDSREAPAEPFTTSTQQLTFRFADAPPAGGSALVRLSIDGVHSVLVNRAVRPPVFFNQRIGWP
jgi:Pvc16 N-terminal domain